MAASERRDQLTAICAEHAVRIDGEVVEDAQRVFAPGFEGVLQIGKRNFARVRLMSE